MSDLMTIRPRYLHMPLLGLLLLLVALIVPSGVDSFLVPPQHQRQPYSPISQSQQQHPQKVLGNLGNLQKVQLQFPQSTVSLFASSQQQPDQLGEEDDDASPKPKGVRKGLRSRARALVQRMKRPLIPFLGSLAFWWAVRSTPAQAKFAHEVSQNPTVSLRPGMSRIDADDLIEGRKDAKEFLDSSSVLPGSSNAKADVKAEKQKQQQQQKKKSDSLYGDEDDADEDDDEFDLDFEDVVKTGSGRQADQAVADALKAKTTSQFATYHTEKSPVLYIKVASGLFVPTFGGMFLREFLRRRREEEYVVKSLEILEAQKAEYFNVTSTADDADVEDELKDIKNNSTKQGDDDDDDDDDDDSDDDDDDDEEDNDRPPPRRPKRPSGGGDDGGNSGGGSDPGYGSPTDEEVDRLTNLFNKS